MQLKGEQIGEFRAALLNAFDVDSFQIMMLERLDKELSHYAPMNKDFPTILFELIKKANREEWVDELILKSKEAIPKNQMLYAFAQKMGLTFSTTEQFQELERMVVASNKFLDISLWTTTLSQIESQVCRIEIEYDQGKLEYGTGFLIGSNILMTNYHVMEAVILGEDGKSIDGGFSAKATSVKCQFDYKHLAGKVLNEGTVYKLHRDWKVDFSPNSSQDQMPSENYLDYAIIRLEGHPGEDLVASKTASIGEKRGWIKLPESIPKDAFAPNSPLLIIQHPKAAPLKLALETNAIIGLNENKTRIRYKTNTEPGSSGSPCFTQQLELIALHHSGDTSFNPLYNEGIPFSAITTLLKKRNISLDTFDFELNSTRSSIPITEQRSKAPINSTENQTTKLEPATPIAASTVTATPSTSATSVTSANTSTPSKQILSLRQGAIKTTIVAFVIINGLKEIGGVESVELLAKLHFYILSLVNKQPQLSIEVLSSLLGAIILFPSSTELDPLDTIKLIIELNNQMNAVGIPIKVGMSLGSVQELIDIDGKANFIGVCINQAARLATAKMDNHPGLLVNERLANHLQAGLRASHWLSSRNSSRLSVEVAGKRNEKFLCYYPPITTWPTLANITYHYDESFQPRSKNAALIAYDLPSFSDGDLNQLSQRFRAITDVFLALITNTKLSLEYFFFSPGGDGGVMVFTDLEKKPVYDLAKNFAEQLLIESQNKNSLISVDSKIGLHFGSILLYENAQGDLRPTGDDIFIADAITGDDAAKQADKLIFTQPFVEAVSSDTQYFNNNFYSLPILKILAREIKRYSAKTSNSNKNEAQPQPTKPDVVASQTVTDNQTTIKNASHIGNNPLRHIWEEHREITIKKLTGLINQLNYTTNEADKISINIQIGSLERELQNTDNKLLNN